ncbi:multiple sugar transport system substrate-binding protein [Hydrogenoanaerobacterium saccharovorans]|uniref:Multiple sugar transport system substrate-binding protein n=1 Tax=Hydrogenoanaerobacterium saccharovorans TaxID=474960 RepID=A0A1H8ANR0_9FIRM|nr:extracellular solute-binding protein [Hydrogenoanaerobacterium saccharovorans]RPF47842.1 multiple sugar transport system substrate-binding protein [Hydrogenoanaerobacterium saccharovorans]SEM72193.1 multiple sugar transport system substrate-binding protein [Hydrogenoanaerobacterium saccharovorans]
MPTIKDIAKLAGVSQGTVSNVLNGKSNVSSKKIQLVEKTALELGYTINERAKLLRKGSSQILAVILPNILFKPYVDFFMSFKAHAESHGYSVLQYITNDNPNLEKDMIVQIKSALVAGIATISCLADAPTYYFENVFPPHTVLFVERKPNTDCCYIGFDYKKCGHDLAIQALNKNYSSVSLLTGNLTFSNELEIYQAFCESIQKNGSCRFTHIQTDMRRKSQNTLQLFNSAAPLNAIFISNYGFAETVKDIWKNFYSDVKLSLYTVSPVFTMPENDFKKYELNYRLLGKESASQLLLQIEDSTSSCTKILNNYGFRDWFDKCLLIKPAPESINVLTLDSPEASIMQNLSPLYTAATGTNINIAVFSYEELHDIISNLGNHPIYDVIRLDVTWLSWFANQILFPLEDIDPNINSLSNRYLDGVLQSYSIVNNKIFALPTTPSIQLLFYRTDLFDSVILKRMFQEQYKRPLAPPTTFDEFNKISRFFTKRYNPASPVEYGATLTLGSSGVACSEFLARFFSHCKSLFDDNGNLLLNTPEAEQSLNELIELKTFSKPQYNNWWKDTAAEFSQGNAAMAILYSNYASDLLKHSSKIIGNIGCTFVPGNNPVLGGGTLGVSKYSEKADAALSFIKWVCSEPVSSAATLLGSVSACKQTYENYELIDAFPWLELVKSGFSLSKHYRAHQAFPCTLDERQLMNIIGKAVKNAYCNATTSKEALKIAQQEYAQIVKW